MSPPRLHPALDAWGEYPEQRGPARLHLVTATGWCSAGAPSCPSSSDRSRSMPPDEGLRLRQDEPMPQPEGAELDAIRARREELKNTYLHAPAERPASTVRGVHHLALIAKDVEETIRFYQDILGFPLVELVENRDYTGRATSSSTSATATCSASSTSPATTTPTSRRRSAACSTSRCPPRRRTSTRPR